jgi:ribosomal protein S27E
LDLFLTTSSEKVPGPDLKIDCPKCNQSEVPARSFEQRDRLFLFFVIPLFRMSNTFVTCSACGTKLHSQLSISELEQHREFGAAQFVSYEISIVIKCLAVLALAFCLFPLLGLLLSVPAVIATRNVTGWMRKSAIIALVVSSIVTVLILIALAMDA